MPLPSKPPTQNFELGYTELALLFIAIFAIGSQLKRIADALEKQTAPPAVAEPIKPITHA